MGDAGSGMPSWAELAVGERIVAAAWRAVAAHLAQQRELEREQEEQQRVAAGGAGELDPLTDGATGAELPAGHGRLR